VRFKAANQSVLSIDNVVRGIGSVLIFLALAHESWWPDDKMACLSFQWHHSLRSAYFHHWWVGERACGVFSVDNKEI